VLNKFNIQSKTNNNLIFWTVAVVLENSCLLEYKYNLFLKCIQLPMLPEV